MNLKLCLLDHLDKLITAFNEKKKKRGMFYEKYAKWKN